MYVPTPSSAYRSIFKLPPGCTMTCSSKGVDISQYWDLPLPDAGEEEPVTRDTAEQILDLLEVAVRRQMIADVPLGALLSGGLDSTTVTAIMAQKLRVPVKTFTVGFEHKSYDESNEARLVARTLRTNHFEEHGRPPLDQSLKELVAFFDEPFADYSCIPTYMVAQLAAQHVKVVLTGDGGDEIFAGYPTHVAPKVAAWYRLLPGWIRNHCVAPVVHRLPTSLDRISFDYKAKRFVTGSDLPLDRGHYWWKIIFSDEEKRRLCSPDWLNGSMGDSFEAIAPHFKRSERAHPVNRLLYVDSKTFLVDDNLTKVDRMTMALSLEARVPLLDHELVETLAKLDPRGKLPGLKTKHLLRDAVKDILPPDIRRGKKRGFTPPLPYWINQELRGFVQDTLSPERVANTGLLDATYCRTLLHDHFARRRDNNRQIWTLVALIIWWERNFGGI
jgi:asparagine synthase (glutamine-hydrolysing)